MYNYHIFSIHNACHGSTIFHFKSVKFISKNFQIEKIYFLNNINFFFFLLLLVILSVIFRANSLIINLTTATGSDCMEIAENDHSSLVNFFIIFIRI